MSPRAARGGLSKRQTPAQTARAFADLYGAAAEAAARDRIRKAGTPSNESYWHDVERALASIPLAQRGAPQIGRCARCGRANVRLPAELLADPGKHVCAKCHADPAVPTMTRGKP